MKASKSLLVQLSLLCVVLSSCKSTGTLSPAISIQTQPSVSTATVTPTLIPVAESTPTARSNDEPGLIVTLDGGGHADLGIPVFSPDGKVVALAGSVIRLWDVSSLELIRELTIPNAGVCFVRDAKFSPDSNLFAVSLQECDGINTVSASRIVVWDLKTGDVLQEWKQEPAKMLATSSTGGDYTITVSAMTFLPNNSSLIFASGNTLEIRDVYQEKTHDVIKLGLKMYASQISRSPDGRLAYVVMHWMKTNDLPENWVEQHKLQIWNIHTHALVREIKYPESWAKLRLYLQDTSLVVRDFERGRNQILNLETGEVKGVPFPLGLEYYSADGRFIASALLKNNVPSIELWSTASRQNIYTFAPEFETDWLYSIHGIAFSPDHTILAIAHHDQLSLWNIQPVVEP